MSYQTTCQVCGGHKENGIALPTCDECGLRDELTQLRARVKELEQKESNLFIISNDMIKRRDARIRELEEAMPDPIKIREIGKAGTCGTGYMKYWTDACEIASRINAVMRKEGNE